ncbi:interactor of constitutive active ROPs 2 chloroplastic isoform X3 [Prunus yedoensis var. nudiflora]|uniref:Interactor of constitutive active ROPs 2 chloroplastic isoform X3 n=1 Tax=Prunus yedoensis var. nudiflora TaxID=2094558 RepID=A0A314UW34_PRUYE|nr:interactor of constitutive active ROPs 2 chloroplastic isoform X3 [Prunus yedoensis var. nudiflora]
MQTPKANRIGSLEVPQRKSPATPRTSHQLKTPGSEPDSVSSPNVATRTPKNRSPKVIERRSPRSPAAEKKQPKRVSDLESQLSQLQEDLKRTKDQLNSSESLKRRFQQEAEEAKNQILAMSAKLEDSQQQLQELSTSEDARVQELRKLSQDRDRAWESELEAVKKQRSMDSTALASAINEIQKLKGQLERVAESEATQSRHAESAYAEIQTLRLELSETLSLVEKLKTELNDCKDSEARALEVIENTHMQLEAANATIEMLKSDGIKATESGNSLSLELEQSKARVKSLEGLVSKLQAELINRNNVKPVQEDEENEERKQLKAEVNSLKSEVGQLKSALEAAEVRYQEEYIQSTLQIRSAYEEVDSAKSESSQREAELTAELKKTKAHIEELRAQLMDKEIELQSISEANDGVALKIEKNISTENESELALELKKSEAAVVELKAKAARAAEREALMKLGYLTEEADKSTRKAERVTEQLDAAQNANMEMEAELRRLKVQSDQWRKAAEAAAAMISTGNNGKLVERTGSLDSSYNPLSSPYSEDLDDDSPKKKNGNMLKKIGVLWKKGQK